MVIALACLVIGFGVYTFFKSRLDVFPEFAPPLVVIQTEAPGLSAEQVEVLVTQLIENTLGGIIGLETMRSQSIQGLSVITMIFHGGTDIYRARQLVTERLNSLAGQLPRGVKPPAMTPLSSSTNQLLAVGLTSDVKTPMELRTIVDWTVKPRILGVPGVGSVSVFGGEVKQLQIQIDPQELVRYGLSLQDVLNAARRATGVRGGGFLENQNQRIILNLRSEVLTPAQLARVVIVHKNGIGVHMGDIAQVTFAPAPPIGGALVEGQSGVILMINSQFGADTLTVTQAVEQALKDLQPLFTVNQIAVHPDLFRPVNFILAAINGLGTALLLGAVLVVIVLFLFLFNVHTAFISATAIPLSLIAAVIALHYLDVSLNTMTLGGLAIALGVVVDDAIVYVENIFRRLRINRTLPQPLPITQVIVNASVEVRSAVVYATFIVVLVFMPVLTLTGVAGKLFAPLGIAYILAILSSLFAALTVTPALAYAMLHRMRFATEDPWLIRQLKAGHVNLITRVERHSRTVIVAVALLCVGALAVLPFFSIRFLPELREGHYIVHMTGIPGTSLNEALRVGAEVTAALRKLPGVRSVSQRAGRAEKWIDTQGPHFSEFDVDLKPLGGEEQRQLLGQIRQTLNQFPGLGFTAQTYLTERIEETISGYAAQVIVNIFGNDLDVLDIKAAEVAKVLNRIPGATYVQLQSPQGTPQLVIRLREDQLARWGFAPLDVLDSIQAAYEGAVVAQVYEGSRVFDVSVLLNTASRQNPTKVGALPLRSPEGIMIPLYEIADIYQASGRYVILHSGAQRLQTVTANVTGRPVSDFVEEAQKRVNSEVSFPKGFYTVFAGEAEAQAQSQRDLFVYSIMAGVVIIALLFFALRSTRALLLVMANLPFAFVGGVLTVLAQGGMLTLGSLVGFVTLFGITLRNSIMLISHYQHLVSEEGMTWGMDAAIRGASERLVPILMTALVTALGLLPLAVQSGEPGNEIEGPMAAVILGGLVTSTLLNLFVLPTLALRYGRFTQPR